MTILGALTATARPSSCSTDTKLYGIDDGHNGWGFMGPTDSQACFPPNYKAGPSNYYYPASSCPYGYTVACDPTPTSLVQDNSIVTQIAYTCCPTQQSFTCVGSESTGIWVSLHCVFVPTASWSTTITSVYLNGSTKVTPFDAPTGGDGYQALAIELQAPTPTTSSTDSASQSATSSSGANESSGAGTGFSAGADAGIGIAVALVGIAAGVLVFLWCRKRRNRNRKRTLESHQHVVGHDQTLCQPKDIIPGTVHEMGNLHPNEPEIQTSWHWQPREVAPGAVYEMGSPHPAQPELQGHG